MTTANFEAHKYNHKILVQEIFQKNSLRHPLKAPYVGCAINGTRSQLVIIYYDHVPADISYIDANYI